MKAALFPRSLSLYEAWTSRYRWRITSLMLKSPGQGRGWEARRACNKIIRMTLPNRPEKDVLLSANKWGLAAAWPRSFRLMSWRNRQSLSGHNMQRGSSITAPPRPHLRLRTCSSRVLPGGAEQRVALADQQITDHPLLVCWYLKHLPGDFRNVAVCCGDNHITESTDGGGTHLSICTKRIVCVRLSHTGDQSETFWNASVREEEKGLWGGNG